MLTIYHSENDIDNVIFEHFAVEDEVFGEKQVIDLKPEGRDIEVTNDNKKEYVEYVAILRLPCCKHTDLNS